MLNRSLVLLPLLFVAICDVVVAADPIVYSRCPRTTHTLEVTRDITVNGETNPVTKTFYGLSGVDILPDVTNFFGGFNAPCDLVLRQSNGSETIIHNCTAISTSADACAALDPAVSFDATKITFAVFKGALVERTQTFLQGSFNISASGNASPSMPLGFFRLSASGSHICTYTILTQSTACSNYVSGIWDSGPAYLSNGRIAFTSNRDGHRHTMMFPTNGTGKGTRIYTMDQDFKNVRMNSHYSLSIEQHPYQLKNGRLAFSSWQISFGHPNRYENGGGPGWVDTTDNLFHLWMQDPDGANNFPIYGQHSGDHLPQYTGKVHDAAHFLTQTSDGRIWAADYYRDNNRGLGWIVGVMQEPEGQEGFGPFESGVTRPNWYMPRDAVSFAPWGTNADRESDPMPSPAYTHPNYPGSVMVWEGKLGHPAAHTGNRLMVVWGKGHCGRTGTNTIFANLGLPQPSTLVSGNGSGLEINMETELQSHGYEPIGCDAGIYVSTQIASGSAHSTHPSDLEMIVDSTDWHEIFPRAVVPYSAIHGVEKPTVIPPSEARVTHAALPHGTAYGLLGAASITDRETHPRYGVSVRGKSLTDDVGYGVALKQHNQQGTDTIDYVDADMCGVRILGLLPNRGGLTHREITNVAGERTRIIGEVSVRNNLDGNNQPIIDPSGNPDTSFLLSMPANVPFLLQAIDCEGRTLNTDRAWQALKPGEMRVCGGCHVHSKPTRITFDQSYAATSSYTIPELGRGTVPLIDGSSVPGYGWAIDMSDIKPIFDQHCISCHGGTTPAGQLDLSDTGGVNSIENESVSSTWFCLIKNRYGHSSLCPGASGGYPRPQLTKYVRAFNALGSLLYWKAANQRTDNRTDAQIDNDIDFGANHPTTITSAELKILSRWIDTGAAAGPQEKKDTQRPTMNIVAIKSENDEITGLNIGVTDLGSGINADSISVMIDGNNFPISVAADDVTNIPISSPISDPDTELVFSISDASGNTTQETLTAGYLMNVSSHTSNNEPGTGTAAVNVYDVNNNLIRTYNVQIDLITGSITGVDTIAPVLLNTSPKDGATMRGSDNIILVFNEDVAANSGNITITNGTDTHIIPVRDTARVKFNGNTVTIRPQGSLSAASNYHVLIGEFAIADTAGNTFGGIDNSTIFNFTTQ